VRRTAVVAVLAWVALWPLAHRALVARYELSPWKLSSFAMYASPHPPILVALLVPSDGRLVPLDETALPTPVRIELDRFRVERHVLGRLRQPDDLARAVLAERPDLPTLLIAVQRTWLDPATAHVDSASEQFGYDRTVLLEP
jgi:hypothetical protein